MDILKYYMVVAGAKSQGASYPSGYIRLWTFAGDSLLDSVVGATMTKSTATFIDGRSTGKRGLNVTSASERLIISQITGEDCSVSFWHKTPNAFNSVFGAMVVGTQNQMHLLIRPSGNVSTYNGAYQNSSFTCSTNTYYHFCVVKSGLNAKIYVNGNKVLDISNSFSNNTYPVKEFASYVGSPYGEIGIYEDFLIYQRVLNDQEVLDIYNIG